MSTYRAFGVHDGKGLKTTSFLSYISCLLLPKGNVFWSSLRRDITTSNSFPSLPMFVIIYRMGGMYLILKT